MAIFRFKALEEVLNRRPVEVETPAHIISDFCIGADGEVDTVCLFSDVPIQEVESIFLDYQSKTSVELLKILLKEYWQVSPKLIEAKANYEKHLSKILIQGISVKNLLK